MIDTRPCSAARLAAALGLTLLCFAPFPQAAAAADAAAGSSPVTAEGPKGSDVVTSIPATAPNAGAQAKLDAMLERQRLLDAAARLPLPARGKPNEAAKLRAQLQSAPVGPKSALTVPVQAGPIHSIMPKPTPMTPEDAVRPMPAATPAAAQR